MLYRVELSSVAYKDLRRVPPQSRRRIHEAAAKLRDDPRPPASLKLVGEENSVRIRVGDFRLIYRIFDAESRVVIGRILRRNESTYRRRR